MALVLSGPPPLSQHSVIYGHPTVHELYFQRGLFFPHQDGILNVCDEWPLVDFYLLFCRDFCVCARCGWSVRTWPSVCVCVHVCVILWKIPHIFKYVLAKSADPAFPVWHRGYISPFGVAVSRWIKCYVSPTGCHCEKNQRISHALLPFPLSPPLPFCLCIWIYFIIRPQHVWQGVWCFCDGEILNEPWGEMRCSLANLQDHRKKKKKKKKGP